MVVGGYAVAFHGFPRFTKAIDVTFIGRDALIRNKRASGRQRDLGDLEELL